MSRVVGVTGDLVPILEWRWSTSGGSATGDAVVARRLEPIPGGADSAQFFGPSRDGTLPGPILARDWQAKPPKEIWRHAVGGGWSGLAVSGRSAVTQE